MEADIVGVVAAAFYTYQIAVLNDHRVVAINAEDCLMGGVYPYGNTGSLGKDYRLAW